jgi:hypothetical protein
VASVCWQRCARGPGHVQLSSWLSVSVTGLVKQLGCELSSRCLFPVVNGISTVPQGTQAAHRGIWCILQGGTPGGRSCSILLAYAPGRCRKCAYGCGVMGSLEPEHQGAHPVCSCLSCCERAASSCHWFCQSRPGFAVKIRSLLRA